MSHKTNTYDKFVESNLGLVHSCCKHLTGKGIEYEDLYSAGCLGLIKAVKGFDESRGLKFSTYAVPVILGEIRRLFRDGGAVKVSRSVKELSLKITKISQKLSQELEREPTVCEIAAAMNLPKEQTAEAICAARPPVSLTCSDDDGDEHQIDLAVDGVSEAFIDTTAIKQCLELLEPDERKIIVLRYFKGLTQSVTAKALGVSQVQISRRERQILGKMRVLLE